MFELSNLTKKQSIEKYGTWFPEEATPEQLISKCNKKIESYRSWSENLETLKAEQKQKVNAKLIEAATETELDKDAIDALLTKLQAKRALLS